MDILCESPPHAVELVKLHPEIKEHICKANIPSSLCEINSP